MHIIHNPATQRFEATIDGHATYLSDEIIDGTNLITITMDYACDHGKTVVLSCGFGEFL